MSGAADTPIRNALRTGAILFVFALAGTTLLALTHDRTAPVIAASAQAEQRTQIGQVLTVTYDNDLLADRLILPPTESLGTRLPSSLWRARQGDTPVALVIEAVAPDGYGGDIALLIGVNRDGTVSGVRVTAHRETPGLGDYIETRKSDWIRQFDRTSLAAPPPQRWAVKKDGGVFDARAGATITPRAIVKAVQRTLDYVARHPQLWHDDALASRPDRPTPTPP